MQAKCLQKNFEKQKISCNTEEEREKRVQL